MALSPDERAPMAMAVQWVARITTISLEMVIPGFIGLWIDGRAGTKLLFAVIGFALGLVTGIWHLVQMAQSTNQSKQLRTPSDKPQTDDPNDA